MKIFIVLESLGYGGVEKNYLRLANYLLNNYEIFILVERQEGELYNEYKNFKFLFFNKSYKRFANLVETIKPQIVFVTKGYLIKYIIYSKIITKAKFKSIAALHSSLYSPHHTLLVKIKRLIGSLIFYRFVDKIRTISMPIYNQLTKIISPNKVVIIKNLIITDEIEKKVKEEITCNDKFFVSVGRLSYLKGYDILIEIFDEFLKIYRHEDIKLYIIGDGEFKKDIISYIKEKKLEDKIILKGKQSNPYKYMKKAIATLLTSRIEGYPTVLVESAFCECPFIAFDCLFGPKEIVKDLNWGFLIPYGDKKKFIEAMQEVIEKRESILKKLDKTKLEFFKKDKILQNYIELFEGVCR